MSEVSAHYHLVTFFDLMAINDIVASGNPDERPDGGIETHGLLQNLTGITQLRNLIPGRFTITADLVGLGAYLVGDAGVLGEQIQAPGQSERGRFSAGPQILLHLINHLLVTLLRRFEPEYVGEVPAKIQSTVTLCPQGGLNFIVAKSGETVEMVEQTWTLAADMVCKALFDRKMPFNPHFVFGMVKTYTNVMNHKEIRLKKVSGELTEVTDAEAAKAMEHWAKVPDSILGAPVLEHREKTLLNMILEAEADPDFPEFDHQQVRRCFICGVISAAH